MTYERELLEDLLGTWRRHRPIGPAPAFLGQPLEVHPFIPPDRVVVLNGVVYVPAYSPTGYPHPLARWVHPTPGYTRHTLGARELARDRRRRSRSHAR